MAIPEQHAQILHRLQSIRPSLQDVERCTRAEPRSRRGIGSRHVPHRLNSEEHVGFLIAQRKGFAVVKNGGGRRERKGSTLLNCLRQRADALAVPLIWVEQHKEFTDLTCIDYSPLRSLTAEDLFEAHTRALSTAATCHDTGVLESQEPWSSDGDCKGAAAALLPLDQVLTRPIWALHPLIARFKFCWQSSDSPRSGVDNKSSKRLATALAAEFGTAKADFEAWHDPDAYRRRQ